MKKIVKNTLSVACALCCAFSLAGCFQKSLSAYEIAVQNGFQGDEAAWLRSLQGANGEDGEDLTAQQLYEAWKAAGNEGSFNDFCKSLNITLPEYNDTTTISKNMRSVVSVCCNYTKTVRVSTGYFSYRDVVQYKNSVGSGVIVRLDEEPGNAYILTNYHVIYNKDSDEGGVLSNIWVYPYGATNGFTSENGDVGGEGIKATYVGGVMDYDIAVLKIQGSEYIKDEKNLVEEAVFGNSDRVKIGQEAFVIGNAAGAGISVTNGIISVDSEYIAMEALDERDLDNDGKADTVPYRVMRTSAAINGGNSGGGIFNAKGELIGIVNAKNAQSTTDNMGYALPVSQVKAIYENILDDGKVLKGKLGIIFSIRETNLKLDDEGNARITEVIEVQAVEDGSAAAGKLSSGDVLLTAQINDGESVDLEREYKLAELLLTVRVGDKMKITLLNASGDRKTVEIVFGENNFDAVK